MEELRIDMRERTPEEQETYNRQAQLMFQPMMSGIMKWRSVVRHE